MQIITTIKEMQAQSDELRRAGKRIGFVPTMGYLHEGHLSLLDLAKQYSNVRVMSIFVNPTQFAPTEDLAQYPRDFVRDERLASNRGCDILFYPETQEMYPVPYRTYVLVEELTARLCGTSRPTFFRGVTTVVAKLFNIVKPHIAVFGQKDAQQALVIKQMIRDLNLDLEIIIGPIVREPDGLAMSSRNQYLSPLERADALALSQSLTKAKELIDTGERDTNIIKTAMTKILTTTVSAKIDYIEIVSSDNLAPLATIAGEVLIAIAVWIGKTRLIDNLMLRVAE